MRGAAVEVGVTARGATCRVGGGRGVGVGRDGRRRGAPPDALPQPAQQQAHLAQPAGAGGAGRIEQAAQPGVGGYPVTPRRSASGQIPLSEPAARRDHQPYRAGDQFGGGEAAGTRIHCGDPLRRQLLRVDQNDLAVLGAHGQQDVHRAARLVHPDGGHRARPQTGERGDVGAPEHSTEPGGHPRAGPAEQRVVHCSGVHPEPFQDDFDPVGAVVGQPVPHRDVGDRGGEIGGDAPGGTPGGQLPAEQAQPGAVPGAGRGSRVIPAGQQGVHRLGQQCGREVRVGQPDHRYPLAGRRHDPRDGVVGKRGVGERGVDERGVGKRGVDDDDRPGQYRQPGGRRSQLGSPGAPAHQVPGGNGGDGDLRAGGGQRPAEPLGPFRPADRPGEQLLHALQHGRRKLVEVDVERYRQRADQLDRPSLAGVAGPADRQRAAGPPGHHPAAEVQPARVRGSPCGVGRQLPGVHGGGEGAPAAPVDRQRADRRYPDEPVRIDGDGDRSGQAGADPTGGAPYRVRGEQPRPGQVDGHVGRGGQRRDRQAHDRRLPDGRVDGDHHPARRRRALPVSGKHGRVDGTDGEHPASAGGGHRHVRPGGLPQHLGLQLRVPGGVALAGLPGQQRLAQNVAQPVPHGRGHPGLGNVQDDRDVADPGTRAGRRQVVLPAYPQRVRRLLDDQPVPQPVPAVRCLLQPVRGRRLPRPVAGVPVVAVGQPRQYRTRGRVHRHKPLPRVPRQPGRRDPHHGRVGTPVEQPVHGTPRLLRRHLPVTGQVHDDRSAGLFDDRVNDLPDRVRARQRRFDHDHRPAGRRRHAPRLGGTARTALPLSARVDVVPGVDRPHLYPRRHGPLDAVEQLIRGDRPPPASGRWRHLRAGRSRITHGGRRHPPAPCRPALCRPALCRPLLRGRSRQVT